MDEDLEELLGRHFPGEAAASEPMPWAETVDSIEDFLPPEDEPLPTPPEDELAAMPEILVRSLNKTLTAGWTYNPRSDRHSIVKCLGLLYDLVRASPVLAEHLRRGVVVFGINSKVKGKALDLVIGLPERWTFHGTPRTFGDLVQQYEIQIQPGSIGDLREGVVRKPLLAVEAKAVMTDHAGALPRLSDELERFRLRVESDSIAAALVLVNVALKFVSPGRNGYDPQRVDPVVNSHREADAERVVTMLEGLPSRESPGATGFDSIGLVAVNCQNDGTPITVRALGSESLAYGTMVRRLAATYEERYGAV